MRIEKIGIYKNKEDRYQWDMLSGIVPNVEKRTEKLAMHGYMEALSEIARLVIKNILIVDGGRLH